MQKVVRGALISQLNGYIYKCKHVAEANEPGRLDFFFFFTRDEAPPIGTTSANLLVK